MVEEDGERRKTLNLPSPKGYAAVLSGVKKIQKVTQITTKPPLPSSVFLTVMMSSFHQRFRHRS